MLCEGWMEPLCIENCTRVKVKGLTIDYKRKPFSSGEIVSVQPDCFDVQFAGERTITEEIPLTRMTIWNKEKNRMYPNPIYFPKRELLGGNRVRFHHKIPAELLGADAGVLHSFHFRPAILIHRSVQTELEDVTIHSQAGMGIVGFDSKDILIKRLAVVPAPGYYISTNTDATHFACCLVEPHSARIGYLDCTVLTNILFVSYLPRFSVTNAPSKREDIWGHQRYHGTVLWCTFPSHQNGVLDANVCDRGCKRLRGRLQTFAGRVANVCV